MLFLMTSGVAPMFAPITGLPEAQASKYAMPNASLRLGIKNTSVSLKAAIFFLS
ncbi:hypothetical protein ES704_02109 [subsurface metagenome]